MHPSTFITARWYLKRAKLNSGNPSTSSTGFPLLACMPKVEVVHAQSPLCQWSWGYEPVINRLERIYGKQVEFTVTQAFPYMERAKWLEDYEMNATEAIEWVKADVAPRVGLPMTIPTSWDDMPASTYPAGAAVAAARIVHGETGGRKLARALMFANLVEGRDTADPGVIESVVRAAGLDHDSMIKASADDIDKTLSDDMHRAGHGANFFSLIVREPSGETSVSLAYAYDPARVEHAIDYMSGGKLKKAKVKPDVMGYAEEVGSPIALLEVRKMFALDAARAKAILSAAVKRGELVRTRYACGDFWSVATDE